MVLFKFNVLYKRFTSFKVLDKDVILIFNSIYIHNGLTLTVVITVKWLIMEIIPFKQTF